MQVGQLSWDATIQDSEFQAQINRIENGLISLTDRAKKSGDELEGVFKRAAVAAASYFSVQATTNFIRSIIETRGEFQQLEIAFTTMLRSKEKADALMKDVVEFAATTPFDLRQVASGTKQLLAYGFAAEDMQENLSMLGNVASGVGSQINDLIYLYGTLRASGRVTQMDINQFAGRGIPIYEELARVLQINVEQVREFVSAGKVGFKDIEASFKNMTAEPGMFYNLMQEQSKSLTGQIANLQDAWESMLNEMGKSQEGILSKSIEGVAYLVENYQKILDMIKLLIASYGVYRAALIVNSLALSGLSAMELLHYGRLVVVQRAQALLNLTMLANPYVAVAATATILAAALYTFADRSTMAERAQSKLNDVLHEAKAVVVEQTVKLKDLIDVAKDETRSKNDRQQAIREINSISDEYLGNITLETIGTKEATKAIDDYVTALNKKAKEEALYNKRVELHKEIIAIDAGERDNLISDIVGYGKALVGGNWAKHIAKTRQQAKDAAKEELRVIDEEFKETIKENSSSDVPVDVIQNKKFWEDKKTEAQTALEALSIIEAQGQKGKDLLKKIADFDEKIAAYANKKTKGSKGENSLLSLLKDINDAERKALQSGLEKEDSELDRINERYDNLEKRAKELGLSPAVFTRIDNARKTETGNEKQKQEIDEYKKTIDRQKEIFDGFEDHKTRIGEERAKGMYSAEIGEFDNYIDYIKAELKKLEGDNSIGASLKRTGLNEVIGKAEKEKSKKQAELYVRMLEQAETYNQKLIRKEKEWADIISQAKGTATNEELAVLHQKKEDEINAIKEAELQKLNLYKRNGEEILLFTREQVKEQIKAMRSLLDSDVVKDELRTKIESNLKGLEGVLKLGIDESNIGELERHRDEIIKQIEARKKLKITSPESEKELQELLDQLIEVENKINKINSKGLKEFLKSLKDSKELIAISEGLGLASDAAFMLSDALGGVDTEAGYTLDTIGQLAGSAADLGMAIASGNPVAIIQSGIKAVGTLFSIGKKVKEMNAAARKEVEEYYENAIKGEKAYQDALKARELQIIRNNKAVLDGIRDEMALRKDQSAAESKEADDIMKRLQGMDFVSGQTYKHGTWFRKAKTTKHYESLRGKSFEDLSLLLKQGKLDGEAQKLVERLVELENQGFDTAQVMADLAKEVESIFTGTTSDSLSSTLANLFKEGKTGAEDLATFFEDTMKESMLSTFKNTVLDQAMADFHKKFAESAMSGETLTDAEIESLWKNFLSEAENAQAEWDRFLSVTGLSFGEKIARDIGISLESVQSQFAALFANGTASAEEFGKSFQEIMRSVLMNSFQVNHLKNALEPWYAEIAELTKDGRILKKEDMTRLEEQWNTIKEDSENYIKNIEDISGFKFAANSIADSLPGISNDILNAITKPIEEGVDTFEESMKKAILNTFQDEVLEKEMQAFYEMYAKMTEGGASLTSANIDLLRAKYEEIMAFGKDEIEKLEKETGIALKEIEKTVRENLTGTTLEGLANDISKIFSEPKGEVIDLAKTFEDTMKAAILNVFRSQLVKGELAAFYETFEQMASVDGGLTAANLAELRLQYDLMMAGADEKFRDLEKITGISLKVADEVQKIVEIARESILGTTFESFADGIVEMLARGTTSVQEFGKSFEETMKTAILNTFKTKTLAAEMEAFYEQFYRYTDSGGMLTETEIAALKVQYDKMIKDGRDKLDQIEKVTGMDFTTETSATGMSGAIRRELTEETGGQFTALVRAQVEINKELVKVQQINWQISIALQRIANENLSAINKNTLRTADNTEFLKDIRVLLGGNSGLSSSKYFA